MQILIIHACVAMQLCQTYNLALATTLTQRGVASYWMPCSQLWQLSMIMCYYTMCIMINIHLQLTVSCQILQLKLDAIASNQSYCIASRYLARQQPSRLENILEAQQYINLQDCVIISTHVSNFKLFVSQIAMCISSYQLSSLLYVYRSSPISQCQCVVLKIFLPYH